MGKNAEILALTAQIASLTKTMALLAPLASQNANIANTDASPRKKQDKPPNPPKPGASEVFEYKGKTWKFCATCFQPKGNWNLTHTTPEHRAKLPQGRTPPTSPPNVPNNHTPTAAPSTPVANANVASTGNAQYAVDFL
jgi:hypothetical protein